MVLRVTRVKWKIGKKTLGKGKLLFPLTWIVTDKVNLDTPGNNKYVYFLARVLFRIISLLICKWKKLCEWGEGELRLWSFGSASNTYSKGSWTEAWTEAVWRYLLGIKREAHRGTWREARGANLLEVGDWMEEFIEPRNIIRLQKPPGVLPILHHDLAPAAHDPCTGCWCRTGRSALCQWLTWSQSTLAGSHQARMGVPPSQLLGWVLLFSARFP